MTGRLANRVALITGASQGLGLGIAEAFAREGATVALVARNATHLDRVTDRLRSEGAHAVGIPCDVTDSAAVQQMHDAVVRHVGVVDLLVNNAGGAVGRGRIADLSIEGWRECFELNATSALMCTRTVLPGMRALGRGTIISVASGSGRRPTVESGVAYTAAKASVIALTQFLNLEERQNGIRAGVVILGTTDTPAHHQAGSPHDPARSTSFMPVSDVAEAVVMMAALSDRTTVEEIELRPTDIRAHLPAWRYLGSQVKEVLT